MSGKRLTVFSAMQNGVGDLRRRIKDLRDHNDINNIKDDWIRDCNGKRLHKEWWMDIPTRPTKADVIAMFKNLKPQELNFPK